MIVVYYIKIQRWEEETRTRHVSSAKRDLKMCKRDLIKGQKREANNVVLWLHIDEKTRHGGMIIMIITPFCK